MARFQLKGLSPHAQGYSSNDSSSVTNSFHWTATNTEIHSSHLTSTSNYQPISLFACKVLKNSRAHLLCINCTWTATILFTSEVSVLDMHSTSSTTKFNKWLKSINQSTLSSGNHLWLHVPIFSSECRKRGLNFASQCKNLLDYFNHILGCLSCINVTETEC